MDNISSLYNASALNSAQLEKQKADWEKLNKGSDSEQLMDACKQFESYFLEQVFKEMQKTVPETEYSSNSTKTMVDYYKDNMVQEIAKMSTDQKSLGLAQQLYEQLKRNEENS